MTPSTAKNRFPVPLVLRLALSATFLYLLLRRTSLTEVLQLMGQSLDRWPLALLALAPPGLGIMVAVARWRVLLLAVGAQTSFGQLVKAFLVGNFFNQFFPSTIAGDVARGWWVRRGLESTTLSLTIVTTDRAIGFLGITTTALVVLASYHDLFKADPAIWIGMLLLVLVGVVSVVVAVTSYRIRALLAAVLKGPVLMKISETVQQVRRGLEQLWKTRHLLAWAFVLAVLLQLVIMLHFAYLAFVLQINVNLLHLAALIPVVSLATFLPISINGIGVREVTLTALGGYIGLSAEDAIALAWSFMIISAFYAGIGGLFYAFGRGASEAEVRQR